jgi:1-acyl-sn-glycerol-3-phosphate acyltransferase
VLYELLKPLAKIFYRVYYKLDYSGIKNVPANKPLVISPNHTNGFIDPVSIAIIIKPKVRFFARGDVFKGKVVKWILNDLNMSPMFRLQEGYGEIKKNNNTFEECKELLSKNKALLIFPEAVCVPEKRLQPLKKGLSRIVFQTEEMFDFKKNVWVLPVGLNYTKTYKFRSELFINFGQPVSLKSYEEFYKRDKVRAINDFTKMLENEMRKLIITIKNKDNDQLVEGIHEIYLNQWLKEKYQGINSGEKRFEARKEIAELINKLDDENAETVQSLKDKVIPYLKKLNTHQLRDHLLYPETIEKSGLSEFIKDFFIIWFGMPVYLLAIILHGLPFYIAKNFADKKIKQIEFYASIRVNMAMLIWIPNFLIQLILLLLIFHSWMLLLIYSSLAPLLGFFAVKYYSLNKKIRGRWRLLRMVKTERKIVETLVSERAAIIRELKMVLNDE